MPGIIIISGLLTASNTDVLQGGRLQTVPANGRMIFELQASDADDTNRYEADIQLPNGDTPLNTVLIPGGNTAALAGVIDSRTALVLTFPIAQGGHAVFSVVEVGAAVLTYRISYVPN